MRVLTLVLFNVFFFLFIGTTKAQNAADILLKLKKFQTVGSVLYIAAHPDDENTRLLAYLANERKLRTGYLSLTRGDGGQNLIGDEQGVALGLIRTHELLQARGIDRAEQFFTRAYDFGYSKNPEETLQMWNRDSILSDVVRVIRMYRPDVIICRFPTTGEGGHGHHTASAILAEDAFRLAADPLAFPSSASVFGTWQATSLFWNTFNFGSTNTTAPDQLKVDVGAYNALLGKSYGEIASESRSMHKSQGFGSARQRGENLEYFKFLLGKNVTTDLFESIDLSWKRIPGGASIEKEIVKVIAQFDIEAPQLSLSALMRIWSKLNSLETKDDFSKYWKSAKQQELSKIIEECSGLWLEVSATDFSYVPGDEISATVQAICRNGGELKWRKISFWQGKDSLIVSPLLKNKLSTYKTKISIPENNEYTNPYWLNLEHTKGEFEVEDVDLIGKPLNPANAWATFEVEIEGVVFNFSREIIYKFTDPVKGEVYRPLEILPAVTISSLSESEMILHSKGEEQTKEILLTLTAQTNNVKGELICPPLNGWFIRQEQSAFDLKKKGDQVTIVVHLTANGNERNLQATWKPYLNVDGRQYNASLRRIEYDHIPFLFYLTPCEVKLTLLDATICDGSIAYVEGAGDKVRESLNQVFTQVDEITTETLRKGDLSKYRAIVFGIRAYNTLDELQDCYEPLMRYIKEGGNVVVQYNTNSRVGPLKNKIGPFPFTIARDRVTDERAEVRFLTPQHPVLNYPNKITQKDFEGWIQERGIYFATDVDSAYTTPFSMNDPGDKEFSGSTIIAPYGKGNFVYTGLALFRQLPEGVPGAMRLLINMICLPRHDEQR